MPDFECPECDRPCVAVMDVNSIGTDGPVVWKGDVHVEAIARSTGKRWRLYVHGGADGGE